MIPDDANLSMSIPVEWRALRDHATKHIAAIATLGAPAQTHCKVCASDAPLFDVLDFSKACDKVLPVSGPTGIPVYYWRCNHCGFIFTRFFDDLTPTLWSTLVYNDQYYREVDPDYAERRPAMNAAQIHQLLRGQAEYWLGLDYGGGHGRTAELLRARGYRYDCHDPFGQVTTTVERIGHYNFCSTFEVAEHAPDPDGFLLHILQLCTPGKLAILVGTVTHDGHVDDERRLGWWYAAPRNGHISLHSRRSLNELARRHGLDCLSFSARTHLLTRGWNRREAWVWLARANMRTRLLRLLNHR